MDNNSKFYPSNPLGIIAIFVFFIEAITASSLHLLKGNPKLLELIVYFIIGFPSVIAAAFFLILILKREALFAPSDFKDEENFVKLLSRVQNLELEQKVNEVSAEPPSELEPVLVLADELLKRGELKNVVRLGRGYLKASEYTKAKQFFEYVKSKASKNDPLYFKILANLAYSEIGLRKYKRALKHLQMVEDILRDNLDVWHLAAMAYTFNKLDVIDESETYLLRCKNHPQYIEKQTAIRHLYKDLEVFA